jgi:pantetheine-phosphate adenylyltransferase
VSNKRIAVYPGAFDPPTLGHLDIVRRGLALFDEVVVAVAVNPDKTSLCTVAERETLLREATADLPGVTVDSYEGLTVDYVRHRGGGAILRGIRTLSDFDYESHLALTNRSMTGVETVFVLAAPEVSFISSTLVRQIARAGGDISPMVPPCVASALKAKFG